MNGKQYVGTNALSLEKFDEVGPVVGISLLVDDDTEYFAGSRDGYVMDIECPYGTQGMANDLLANLKGKTYKGFRADAAKIDPSAELGDGVDIKGMYSVLAMREVTFGPGYYSDIEAPGGNELLHEFPYESETRRIAKKNLATAKSSIEKTINSITLDVTGALGGKASIELKVNDQITSSGEVDLGQVRQRFADDKSSITISAGVVTFNSNTFVVNSTNFSVTKEGVMTATAGTIAGWQIGTNSITNGLPYDGHKNSNATGMGTYGSTWAFWAGDGRFSVQQNGAFHAENADITGTVNANAGVFNSVTITNSSLGGTLNAGGTFTGTHSGGSLSSTGGSFTGTHSGGSLSGTSGSFYGGHYNGLVSSCNLGGTSLSMSSGGGSYLHQTSAGGISINATGAAAGVYAGGSGIIVGTSQITLQKSTFTSNSFECTGSKSRVMQTKHFGFRCLDAYETPLPTFSDYGTAKLDENGVCYITIDPIFAETVDNAYLPTVFLTKYGHGDIWVERVEHDTAEVHGTPGLVFAWETRYVQDNAGVIRLRVMGFDYQDMNGEQDFDGDAAVAYEHSAENVDYAQAGYEYFTAFERSQK